MFKDKEMNREKIAEICHELNRYYCQAIDDWSQVPWHMAPKWQIDSCLEGIEEIIVDTNHPPEKSHESWMATKVKQGWVLGKKKSARHKTHPCIKPYDKLPLEQKIKDILFSNTVKALLPLLKNDDAA